MATSGSYDFNLNTNEIITEALDVLGILGEGEDPTADQLAYGKKRLNIMIKYWRTKGISLPLYQELVLFITPGKKSYLIGATGDRVTTGDDYVKTELAVAASSGASTITVDDDTDIANADNIGIVLDDGTIQWTTINGTPSSNVITLTDTLTGDAAVDNHVYTYTSLAQRPLTVQGGRLRVNDDNDIPLTVLNRQGYDNLANKATQGTISSIYYDPQLANGVLYVYQTGTTVNDTVHLTVQRQVQDFDGVSDNADFPVEWLDPIIYNLAVHMFTKYGIDAGTQKIVMALADQFLQDAEDFDVEKSITFVPV